MVSFAAEIPEQKKFIRWLFKDDYELHEVLLGSKDWKKEKLIFECVCFYFAHNNPITYPLHTINEALKSAKLLGCLIEHVEIDEVVSQLLKRKW